MAESSAPASARPRPAILLLLAVALGGVVVYMLWPAAAKPPAPSNPPREQRRQASAAKGTTGAAAAAAAAEGALPSALDVRLDALKQTPAAPGETARNPFRFYVKPPPPPPPPPPVLGPGDKGYVAPPPPPPPPPPPIPAIPLKFIGIVETRGRKVAVFTPTDGKGMPQYAGEGEIVLGQYRVVRIGAESVTMEYLDGRGKQIIPMRG